jgi:two-component system sensor histidine kinase/response regulator
MNLLIVEDDPTSRMVLRRALEAAGHRSVEAANGLEAMEALERADIDAVISDILMPGMDGFRLCHEIRRSKEIYSGVPVILYTATYDSAADRQLAEAAGADGYFLKPTPVSVLLGAVGQVLRGAKSTAPAQPADEVYLLEQYNGALVRKLEQRNLELHEAFAALQAAHENILELNQTLHTRVLQRTAALDLANKDADAFCYCLSHELRAPLRTIVCLTQVLEASVCRQVGGEDLQLLCRVARAAREMDLLIEGLLEVERTIRRDLTRIDVDLEQVLDEALTTLAPKTRGRPIEWRRSTLPRVNGDPMLLRQLLMHLLENAIKYTRTRQPAIIEVGARPGRTEEVVIFLRDNGVGFDLRQAAGLFATFRRLHRADEHEGLGIGLASAQRIVARHGGTIWADAQVGRGATFYFSLPAMHA